MLGEQAAGPVIGTLLVDFFVTSTLCLAIAASQPRGPSAAGIPDAANEADDAGRPASARLAATFGRSLRGAATNPLPWAIAGGAASSANALTLPAGLAAIVKLLADSATPVALFTIGAVLWRAGQHARSPTPLGRYLPLALIKLFVHPMLVLGIGTIAHGLGAPVRRFDLMVLVLAAALPSASNVSLLAERHGADNGRIARIIMASTLLSFGSFSLLAWVLPQWLGE